MPGPRSLHADNRARQMSQKRKVMVMMLTSQCMDPGKNILPILFIIWLIFTSYAVLFEFIS